MSPIEPSVTQNVSGTLPNALHEHWRLFVAEGILLIILGAAAIFLPVVAGLAATIFLGWLFLVAGLFGLLFTLRAKGAPGFAWSLVSALAALVAGALLVWNPFRGLLALTYVLIAFFVFDGLFMILLGLAHRRELSRRWGWMLVNGVIDLILAAIVISGMPADLNWALGLIVGVDMMFGGASLLGIALEARKVAHSGTRI